MKKELNIAAILKDKPEGLKLWSDTFGVVYSGHIDDNCDFPISIFLSSQRWIDLTIDGRISNIDGTLPCIVPSKDMQDWSKLAWKKGDVLRFLDILVVFEKWTKDDYTEFKASYEYNCHSGSFDKGNVYYTSEFCKAIDEVANNFIKKIEETYGGKLNLETLEIEQPKQEFKDGDIVTFKRDGKPDITIILKRADFDYIDQLPRIHYHAMYDYQTNKLHKELGYIDKALRYNGCLTMEGNEFILATDSEKQQLFDALAKKNKAWDAEKKMLVDLPKKCEFETMDWCLMRDHREKWKLCQFGFFDKGDEYEASYNAVGGNWYNECIPYNDQTAHLLGTTNEWKGGEG